MLYAFAISATTLLFTRDRRFFWFLIPISLNILARYIYLHISTRPWGAGNLAYDDRNMIIVGIALAILGITLFIVAAMRGNRLGALFMAAFPVAFVAVTPWGFLTE